MYSAVVTLVGVVSCTPHRGIVMAKKTGVGSRCLKFTIKVPAPISQSATAYNMYFITVKHDGMAVEVAEGDIVGVTGHLWLNWYQHKMFANVNTTSVIKFTDKDRLTDISGDDEGFAAELDESIMSDFKDMEAKIENDGTK